MMNVKREPHRRDERTGAAEEFKEFKEFKERSQEPESRSQEDACACETVNGRERA
jgi:hypothetical protein